MSEREREELIERTAKKILEDERRLDDVVENLTALRDAEEEAYLADYRLFLADFEGWLRAHD
jgi:hypothetical protein